MIHLGGCLGSGVRPENTPFIGLFQLPPFKTNYIFSFGETPGSLVKYDLLAKKH